MRKILFASIHLLLINLIFVSCKQSGNLDTTLSGTVRGFEADSLKITYYQNDAWASRQELLIPLDSAGRFSITLPVHSLKEFRRQQSRVVLQPGWKTTMNIYINEAGETDSTTFNGDGAEENVVYNKNLSLIFDSYNHMNEEPGEFMAFLDSIDQVMEADIEGLKEADQEFVTMLHNNIAYNKMECWDDYVEQNFVRVGKDIPDLLKAYCSQFDRLMVFDNAALLNSDFYKYMLDSHFRDMVRDRVDFDALVEVHQGDKEEARADYNIASMKLMLDLADSIVPNQAIKSYIYFNAFDNVLLKNIDVHLIKTVKQNFADRFQRVVTDTSMTNYIARIIERLDNLSPGAIAPAFSYPDTTGNLINLTDFKGKYVYIDVWATWYVPCIQQMPKLKALEKEFGDEIAFVSISIDTKEERWHKYVEENELTGIQIFSQGGGKAEIMNLYMIQAIPRFIMIDPAGNLIDAHASRPSDDKTRKIFETWTDRVSQRASNF